MSADPPAAAAAEPPIEARLISLDSQVDPVLARRHHRVQRSSGRELGRSPKCSSIATASGKPSAMGSGTWAWLPNDTARPPSSLHHFGLRAQATCVHLERASGAGDSSHRSAESVLGPGQMEGTGLDGRPEIQVLSEDQRRKAICTARSHVRCIVRSSRVTGGASGSGDGPACACWPHVWHDQARRLIGDLVAPVIGCIAGDSLTLHSDLVNGPTVANG